MEVHHGPDAMGPEQRYNGALDLSDMDAPTARLLLEFYLEDLELIEARQKRKQKLGEKTDSELAVDLLKQDIAKLQSTLLDRRIAQSFAVAVHRDAEAIGLLVQDEETAARDHILACELDQEQQNRQPGINTAKFYNPQTTIARKAAELELMMENLRAYNKPEVCRPEPSSSSNGAVELANFTIQQEICIICEEVKHLFDILQAPCGHHYCRECIKEVVQVSTEDESLYPPKCCQIEIPISRAMDFIAIELVERFRHKGEEFSTLDRTYCRNRECSTFIPHRNIKHGVASCPLCQRETCAICKDGAHKNADCPFDPDQQSMDALATEKSWKKCPVCQRRIELFMGCNHITLVVRTSYFVCPANINAAAVAVPSSATSAVPNGEHASAPIGARSFCWKAVVDSTV
ncbi:hypothetical protein MMC26_000184 [Xylographa opegraphella]|nr:hypothetical protein [Xylographa opegraphella]